MKARLTLALCVCAFTAANSGSAATDSCPAMTSLKTSYTSNLQVVVHTDVAADCVARYGKKLDLIAEGMKKDGNLDGVVAVRNEKKRLDTEKTVPADSAPDVIPAVAKARTEYRQSVARAEVEKNRKIVALADSYAASLEVLKKQLTQQDKIEEATLVKQEIDRLRTSAEVTSAQFVLADHASKRPPAADVSKPPPPATVVAAPAVRTQKPDKCRRTVSSRGDASGSWQKTSMVVKQGDTVTINAKGSWKCSDYDFKCGPEGYSGTEVKTSSGYSSGYSSWSRYLSSEPAGALLCKVGENGEPQAVGKSLTFQSSDEGVLYLDVNEAQGKYYRQSCSGTMSVEIEVLRDSSAKGLHASDTMDRKIR